MDLNKVYNEEWYASRGDDSYKSALFYAKYLKELKFTPREIIDIGCGRGAWLKAFKDNGSKKLFGVDGPWNSEEKMIDSSINFIPSELDKKFPIINKKFDLCISIEFAEHLPSTRSNDLIDYLSDLSDVVLFSAAYIGQGGNNHINEQIHSFWGEIFNSKNFRVFDIFRHEFSGNGNINFWFRQNVFLYVKENCSFYKNLIKKNIFPLKNLMFLDFVDPDLYFRTLNQAVKYYQLHNKI